MEGKKTEGQHNAARRTVRRFGWRGAACAAVLAALGGCAGEAVPRTGGASADSAASFGGRPAASRPSAALPLARGALLDTGGGESSGLPGFGLNAIPALYGEYLIRAQDPRSAARASAEASAVIALWVTRERLFFGETWKKGKLGALDAYGTSDAGGPVTALFADDLSLDGWTVLARLPAPTPAAVSISASGAGGSASADPAKGAADGAAPVLVAAGDLEAFFRAFRQRFAYFNSQDKPASEASLPAILEW